MYTSKISVVQSVESNLLVKKLNCDGIIDVVNSYNI